MATASVPAPAALAGSSALATDPTTLDDTSARLIAAAAQVFAEKGYDGAGVAEIARRAGLTTGAIYSRFSGKAQLLAEAVRLTTRDEFDQLFAQHAFQGRAADLLASVGSHLVTRPPQPGHALLLEAFVAARRDPEVALALRGHLAERAGLLAGLVDQGKADGQVDADVDTASIVHFCHAVGLGFLLFEAVGAAHPAPAAWEQLVDRLVGSVSPALPAPPEPDPSTRPHTQE